MFDFIFTFLLAFAVSWAFTPIAIKTAYKVGAIDIPKDNRRMHSKPIPRFGGMAIYLGTVFGILACTQIDEKILGLLAGGTLIFLLGIVDDLKNLSAKVKLLFQVISASVLFFAGIRISFIYNPLIGEYHYFPLYISFIITIIWIVGITNTINLIDGLDGLAAGIAFIASISIAYSAYINGNTSVSIITLALAGATLGFLPHNFNPAKIFMGDAGSLFLGFMLAGISVLGPVKGTTVMATLVPMFALALPIFDTGFAILRRLANKRPIMEADKGHLHHRIMARGFGQKRTVVMLYAISGILGISAVLLNKGEFGDAFFLLVATITIFYVFLKPQREPVPEPAQKPRKKTDKIRVMTVFGTRPEAIKMAPLVKVLQEDDMIESVLCVTAQHREMLDQVLSLFNLIPDYDLNIMKPNQSLSTITANVIQGLDKIIEFEQPDIILVHGDTTTTFATSLSAFYHKVKIGHVEAGLRTYDKYSPFPEEMNRVMTGHLADLHFAPTQRNVNNLAKENISEENIFVTGNTVIDALIEVANREYAFEDETLKNIDFDNKRVITVTCHRRENLGENMTNIFEAIRDLAVNYEDVEVIYPVHLNPKVREKANEILEGTDRVHLIDPLQYQPFVKLMAKSFFIITDSGGMQEEAPSLGKPVLVVRKETERPEAIEAGTAKLAGVRKEEIYKMASELLENPSEYNRMATAINPYGDGTTSKKIVEIIKKLYKRQ